MADTPKSIETTIQQLLDYFPAAQAGPPADTKLVDQIYQQFPVAPQELRTFWSICNGIRLDIDDWILGRIYSVSQLSRVLEWWLDDTSGFHSTVLPIADDACGNFHCLHCGEGPLNGCALFVDQHWTPAYLLAGNMVTYLGFWADSCMAKFSSDGKKDPRYIPPNLSKWPFIGKPKLRHPWPYDEDWLTSRDPDAARILQDPNLRSYFESQTDS